MERKMTFVAQGVPELLEGEFLVQMLSQRSKADYQEPLPNISALVLTAWDVHSWEDLDAVPRSRLQEQKFRSFAFVFSQLFLCKILDSHRH